jgi:hypothetical protein
LHKEGAAWQQRNKRPNNGLGAKELHARNPTGIPFFPAKRSRKEGVVGIGLPHISFRAGDATMGTRGTKIREAIAHLATDGCDLTDPSIRGNLRSDEAHFHLGYLEEDCGFRLSIEEVLAVARAMMRGGGAMHGPANGSANGPAARQSAPSPLRHYYN